MSLRCPKCAHARRGFDGYLQPWDKVRCDICGEDSYAGTWYLDNGTPLGDPLGDPIEDSAYQAAKLKAPTVFVSYVHQDHDHPLLKRLLDDLMFRARINVWIDSERVTPGTSVQSMISQGIHSSDYLLYVVSKNSREKGWAAEEFHIAYARQQREKLLRVIPVLIDKISVPRFLAGVICIDLALDYASGYAQLVSSVGVGYSDSLEILDSKHLNHGSEIISVCRVLDERLLELLTRDPNGLYTLSPRAFEEFIADLFDGFGYQVELTKRTCDGGRDVVAICKREVNLRFLIECKKWAPSQTVGVSLVRQLLGVKTDEGASKAILATTAYFTKTAKLFFDRHPWDLEGKDFHGLVEWIQSYKISKVASGGT